MKRWTDWHMTDGHMDIQCETIIPCQYYVGGYKKRKYINTFLVKNSILSRAKSWPIATVNKALFFIRKMLISFLFLHKNTRCGYSLEAPRWGASNEYSQHMFSWRNKKNIIPPLICSYADLPTHMWGLVRVLIKCHCMMKSTGSRDYPMMNEKFV